MLFHNQPNITLVNLPLKKKDFNLIYMSCYQLFQMKETPYQLSFASPIDMQNQHLGHISKYLI